MVHTEHMVTQLVGEKKCIMGYDENLGFNDKR